MVKVESILRSLVVLERILDFRFVSEGCTEWVVRMSKKLSLPSQHLFNRIRIRLGLGWDCGRSNWSSLEHGFFKCVVDRAAIIVVPD